jgi:hypothetical protein
MAPLSPGRTRPRLAIALAIVLLVSTVLPASVLGQTPVSGRSATTIQTGPVLAADDFSDETIGLLPPSSPEPDDYQQGYEDGSYVVRATSLEWNGSVGLPIAGSYRDSVLSVNVRSVGDRAGVVSLQCRRSSTGGYGAFIFLDRGFYYLARLDGTATRPLELPSTSPYARFRRPGIDLALSCVGDTIALTIDGFEASSARDTTDSEGSSLLGVSSAEREGSGTFEFRFDNLRINQAALAAPTSIPTPPPSTTATPEATPSTATPTPAAMSDADVAARVSPSVVQVSSKAGTGSAVKISQGFLTNHHVVSGEQQVELIRSDGIRQPATVVRSDPWFDLALLSTGLEAPALEVEPARRQRQGDTVLVLGYPYGSILSGSASLTRGLLSAVRDVEGVTYVQTDAAMNFGSSGGAVVNTRGKLIAVTSGGIGRSGGLNFGVAGESIQSFLDGVQLVAPDAAEPDNTREQARPLVVGAAPQLRSFNVAGDVDWLSVALAAGDEVAIFTDASDCDTVLRLYAPDGVTLLDENDDGGRNASSWIGFTPEESGTYYVSASHFERGGACRSYHIAARSLM